MRIEIRQQPFDPWQELAQFQDSSTLAPGSYGACATFVGTMRDFNQGENINSMRLEHYQGMTEKLLTEFGDDVVKRYDLLELLVVHRVGEIRPADPIVLVAAWSAHRVAAFDSCRTMMEHLKSHATFWKKEYLELDSDDSRQRWADNISG
jgi:molybdopterin synthase catalytic subunit